MSESKVHPSVAQGLILKFFAAEGFRPAKICKDSVYILVKTPFCKHEGFIGVKHFLREEKINEITSEVNIGALGSSILLFTKCLVSARISHRIQRLLTEELFARYCPMEYHSI